MKYSIFLCVICLLLLLLLPFAPDTQAAEQWEDGWNPEITYEFDAATGTITLTGTGDITINKSYTPWGNYPNDVKKVVIGEGITGIGANTFSNLRNLTEVVLPKSLTSIGRCAFQTCVALTTIDLSRITTIGEHAFDHCYALTAVDIGSVTSIDSYAFQNSGLQSITIPETLTVVPDRAFLYCRSLRKVILHDRITKIGYSTFQGCSQLTSVQFPKSLKEVDDLAFDGCTSLADIQLNEGLEIIGRSAFNGCQALKTLVIPDSVKEIEDNAFNRCTNLQSVHFGAGLSSITYSTFVSCTNLTTFTISQNNPYHEVHNNGLYTKSPRKLVTIAPGYTGAYVVPEGTVAIGPLACDKGRITSLTIPGTVKKIGTSAFSDCKQLKTVTLEEGTEEIQMYAFARSTITEITIPASVKKMGGGTFSGCTNLTKIVFLGLPPEVGSGVAQKGDAIIYYPGYLSEWKNADLNSLGYYFDYIPDCMGRHDLRWEVIKTPTCKETGWRSETWCIVCRQNVDPEGELPLADHSYGAWTTINAPTTEKEGLSKRTCKICGAFEQKAIPKLDSSATPPTSEPNIPPETEPSQPATSEPSAENPTDPPVTSPSVPEETQPTISSDPILTESPKQGDSSPALWLSVVTIAVVSIIIGMVVSFVIFAVKKKKSKE